MTYRPLINSNIPAQLLQEDEESETELSDQGSEISDHLSVSEETQCPEESSCSDSGEEDLPLPNISTYFIERDKWQKSSNDRVTPQVQNILTEISGTRSNGVGVTKFVQAWNLFITEDIIEKIVIHTNEFIQKKAKTYDRPRDCKPTDGIEIRALFGLLYIAGSLRMSHVNLEDIYATDGTGIHLFTITMSHKRIKFLLNSLRFDDATTRESRRTLDKAAPIRDILEKFIQNCLSPYSVGQDVVIGEMMVDFRGKCPFRQYIQSKPAIKLHSLVDVATFYVLNIELYAGNKPKSLFQHSNIAADIVKRLITPISSTERNITLNSSYTSVSLVEDLAKNHNISVVGTLQKNMKEIPHCFTDKKKLENSNQSGISDKTTLETKVPNKNKSVVLISSISSATEIDESYYNQTKSGVDEVDKKIKMYSTSRKNNRWPLTLFFRLLDIAGINSMVILRANNVVIQKRRKYLRELGIELTKDYIERRAAMVSLPRKLKRNIREHLNVGIENNDSGSNSKTCRGSCKICPAKKRRQSKTLCTSCHRNICRTHTTFVCNECYFCKETDSEDV